MAALIDEKEDDDLAALAPDDAALADLILSILRVHHACPLSTDSPGAVLLRALQRIHGDDYDLGDEHDSAITQLLLRVVQNGPSPETREAAVACLGYLMPSSFLSDLGERPQDWRDGAECGIGIANAISRLEDDFVGDEECAMWCPGPTYLESLAEDPEQAMKVYAELVR